MMIAPMMKRSPATPPMIPPMSTQSTSDPVACVDSPSAEVNVVAAVTSVCESLGVELAIINAVVVIFVDDEVSL